MALELRPEVICRDVSQHGLYWICLRPGTVIILCSLDQLSQLFTGWQLQQRFNVSNILVALLSRNHMKAHMVAALVLILIPPARRHTDHGHIDKRMQSRHCTAISQSIQPAMYQSTNDCTLNQSRQQAI